MTSSPGSAPNGASRHLPNTRIVLPVMVQRWLGWPEQSQMIGWVPLVETLIGSSRHRLEAALTSELPARAAPPATTKATVPCGGTLAEIAPVVGEVAPVQTSRSENELPVLPIACAVVDTVVVALPWLNSATATSPLLRRLARTRRVPSSTIWTPCRPSASWSIAILSLIHISEPTRLLSISYAV